MKEREPRYINIRQQARQPGRGLRPAHAAPGRRAGQAASPPPAARATGRAAGRAGGVRRQAGVLRPGRGHAAGQPADDDGVDARRGRGRGRRRPGPRPDGADRPAGGGGHGPPAPSGRPPAAAPPAEGQGQRRRAAAAADRRSYRHDRAGAPSPTVPAEVRVIKRRRMVTVARRAGTVSRWSPSSVWLRPSAGRRCSTTWWRACWRSYDARRPRSSADDRKLIVRAGEAAEAAHAGPAPPDGRALHHPPGGGGHHRRRPGPRRPVGGRRAAARRRGGHRAHPRATSTEEFGPEVGGHRRRGHQARPAAVRLQGGPAGRHGAQDARGHGQRLAGARHQAGRPAAQHADPGGDAGVEAAPDRPGDPRHLRAAGPPARASRSSSGSSRTWPSPPCTPSATPRSSRWWPPGPPSATTTWPGCWWPCASAWAPRA